MGCCRTRQIARIRDLDAQLETAKNQAKTELYNIFFDEDGAKGWTQKGKG